LTRTEQEVTMESRMKSGQILILVLLIVVVSLAVGLSVASRNLTNLRISTQTEESQRAFSAAEGGVEDVLSRLTTLSQDGSKIGALTSSQGYTETFDVGDIPATVIVKGKNVYETTVSLGEVAQVTLVVNPGPPPTYYTGNITIEWPKEPHVSLEVTLVCENSTTPIPCNGGVAGSGSYSQNRYAFQGSGAPADQTGSWQNAVCSSTCSVPVSIPSGTNARYLRIKPFHNTVDKLKVSGSPDLPTQIYEINSVAKTDLGITRRVQVTRTALPALPAVFDYVLYSEGDIVK